MANDPFRYLPPGLENMGKEQLVMLAQQQAAALAHRDDQCQQLAGGFVDKVRPGLSSVLTWTSCAGGALLDGELSDDSAIGPAVNGATLVLGTIAGFWVDQPDAKEASWAIARGAGCAIVYPEVFGAARNHRVKRLAKAATQPATPAN